jgi:PAS domain S-box-containing protein
MMDLTPPPGSPSGDADAAFVSLTSMMSEIKHWQEQIFGLTDTILTTASADIDAAIHDALVRSGELARADRTYVFLRRDPGRLDNTHEWVADGIEPMIDQLQDLPDDLLSEWRPQFEAGEAVFLPDIAALPADSGVKPILEAQEIKSLLTLPMLDNGHLLGFIGYDSVASHRSFRTFEIQLLRSMAAAMSAVLVRRETERQAAAWARKLQNQTELLRATLAAIPKLVLEVGPDGRFLGFNEGSGMGPVFLPVPFIGRLPEEVLPADAARIWWRAIRSVRDTGECRDVLLRLEVGGEPRAYVVNGGRLALEGTAPGAVFIVRDVTEERRRNKDVARLARIAELTAGDVLILDARGRVEWLNPAIRNRMGLPLESAVGQDCLALLSVADSDPDNAARLGEALRDGTSVQCLLRLVDGGGQVIWSNLDMQAIRSDGGELEGFVLVQSDVTGLKTAEENALEQRATALDIASDGFAVTDGAGRFAYMNAAHRAMFGIAPDVDVSTLTWRDLYPGEAAAELYGTVLPRVLADGSWRGRLTGRHRDGANVPQQATFTLMTGGRILVATQDISAEIAWNLERARLGDDLQVAQRAETIARIASETAHDLNNMIGVVRGAAGMLQLQCADRPEVLQGVDRIERAMEAAQAFVAELGSLERAPGQKATHDLRGIVGDALVILGPDRIYRHHVSTVLPEGEQPVYCASIDVLQVMMNLIWNACDSGSAGPSTVTLTVLSGGPHAGGHGALMVGGLSPEAQYCAFQVSDDGDGIAPGDLPRIFDRYFTSKGELGTGMGLPIVAGMVERNRGALWIDSTVGQGTTVTIAWPSAPVVPKYPFSARQPASAVKLTGLSVLVLAETGGRALRTTALLSAAGAVTKTVSSICAVLERVQAPGAPFSVVVVDHDMPGDSAAALARSLHEQSPELPCILLSSRAGDLRDKKTRFRAILARPVTEAALLRAVRNAATGTDPAG